MSEGNVLDPNIHTSLTRYVCCLSSWLIINEDKQQQIHTYLVLYVCRRVSLHTFLPNLMGTSVLKFCQHSVVTIPRPVLRFVTLTLSTDVFLPLRLPLWASAWDGHPTAEINLVWCQVGCTAKPVPSLPTAQPHLEANFKALCWMRLNFYWELFYSVCGRVKAIVVSQPSPWTQSSLQFFFKWLSVQ